MRKRYTFNKKKCSQRKITYKLIQQQGLQPFSKSYQKSYHLVTFKEEPSMDFQRVLRDSDQLSDKNFTHPWNVF